MPKTNFCKDLKKEERARKEKAIQEMIAGKMEAMGMTNDELATKAGINPRTLYSRRKNPGTMKLEELWEIIKVLTPETFYLERIL